MTKEIILTQRQIALVDDEDYERLSKHQWWATKKRKKFYAATRVNGRYIHLHVLIMNPPIGFQVDHVNGDGLNCQKYNLRLATNTKNAQNVRKRSNNSSGFKGVSYHKASGKFQAQIRVDGVRYSLGLFNIPEESARVYDVVAIQHFGQFACINFPTEHTEYPYQHA